MGAILTFKLSRKVLPEVALGVADRGQVPTA